MKPNLGISDDKREAVVGLLNTLLADEVVLATKTRNYHWNVVGVHFHALHALFQSQYEALEAAVDEVAERVRTLGGWPLSTLAEFVRTSRLKEQPGEHPDARAMLANLLADHEAVVRTLRTDLTAALERYGDAGTSDFLTELLEKHEKMAWMLRAHLEA